MYVQLSHRFNADVFKVEAAALNIAIGLIWNSREAVRPIQARSFE